MGNPCCKCLFGKKRHCTGLLSYLVYRMSLRTTKGEQFKFTTIANKVYKRIVMFKGMSRSNQDTGHLIHYTK